MARKNVWEAPECIRFGEAWAGLELGVRAAVQAVCLGRPGARPWLVAAGLVQLQCCGPIVIALEDWLAAHSAGWLERARREIRLAGARP